jgi:pimeloyl-ACP methyl ester carboxylesterase
VRLRSRDNGSGCAARVPVEGGHVFAAAAGIGPPIVLLHGWRASHAGWDPLLPYLTPTHRCIALDFRGGRGASSPAPGGGEGTWDTTVEDVAAAVRWAGAARPLLVGASWGGKIALVYAARGHPCAGIVCVDGMAYGDAGSLHEDIYDRVPCPIHLVVAARGVYPRDGVEAFARRHSQLPLSWFPTGHDVEAEMPAELAALILAFAANIRPA